VGLTTPRRKYKLVTNISRSLGPGRIPWLNDLCERTWCTGEYLDRIELKRQEVEQNCITRSVVTCNLLKA
jgi:hypothetical protein